VTFDFEKGIPIGPGVDVTIRLQNIFNDEYLVTYLNAQGNHYAPPRELQVGLRFNTAR
jgi:outer membrane receptor protein involved in Fe transport